MTDQQLYQMATAYVEHSPRNRVSPEKALRADLVGMKMFDPPLLGYAAAQDEYLLSLPEIPSANLDQAPPVFWLESAKTVLSFFLPFTEQVRMSNRVSRTEPSQEYKHARVDGQGFIIDLCKHLKAGLEQAGYAAVIPAADPRFRSTTATPMGGRTFTSNWSERHVAYACGLGTFSLSRGIITSLGMAGRLGSLITDLEITPSPRPYHELEEYCTRCGACIVQCPPRAITQSEGKNHPLCDDFLAQIRERHKPYYGCAKCQMAVPCESRNPRASRRSDQQ